MIGSGVIVVGMHRSGTSAITRLVSLLGIPTCLPDDLVRDRTGNLRGHWESRSLVGFNDRLLGAVSAAWWCPPPLETDWMAVAGERRAAALDALAAVHPTASWVWKDPRTCLTLPFWRAALPTTPVFVLAVRHPLAVAASLRRRSSVTLEAGVALWEGYMARVVPAMAGAPTIVCGYDEVLRDSLGWSRTAHRFLTGQGVPLDPSGDPAVAAGSFEPSLVHGDDAENDVAAYRLTGNQAALLAALEELFGVHECFEPTALPPVTPATELFFAEGRAQLASASKVPAAGAHNGSGIKLLRAATRASAGVPPISVVIAGSDVDASLDVTLDAVLTTIPATAQVVVVSRYELPLAKADARVTLIERPPGGGRAAAIAAGTACATGDVVVVCDGGVLPHAGWPAALCGALVRSDAGAVGPALLYGDRATVYGLTLREACLNVAWIRHAPGADAFPVPVVTGAMIAFRREVLDAVGGFDAGMAGNGGEDVELCVRLWRAGYLCLTVPSTSAAVAPTPRDGGWTDSVAFLHNRLRLGAVHLSEPRLGRFLAALAGHVAFPEAFGRVLAGDLGKRRAFVRGLSCFDDAWLFAHFGIQALEEARGESVSA